MSESATCSYPDCQGKIFSRPSALRRHVKAVHEKSEPAFHCDRCQKTFSRKEYLLRHKEAHQGHDREECSICLRSFRFDYYDKHRRSCENKLRKLRIPVGSRKREKDPEVPAKNSKLRWINTSHEAEGNVLEHRSAVKTASVLRTAPFLHSDEFWRERVLFEKAGVAIRNEDMELFDCFAQDLENSGLTIKALDDFIKKAPGDGAERPIPLLCLAAYCSKPLLVESLLKLGADVSEKTVEGATAIHFAKDVDSARLLIRAGADVHHAVWHSLDTPLYRAVEYKDVALASVLLEAGARIPMHSTSDWYISPLDLAIRCEDSQMFELLLRAVVNQRLELPPLSKTAIRYGALWMIEQLLEHGAAFDVSSTEAEALFKDMLASASAYPRSRFSTDAAEKIALLRTRLVHPIAGPNSNAAPQEVMDAMPSLTGPGESSTSIPLEPLDNISSRPGGGTQAINTWTPEALSHPPQPTALMSSADQETPLASSSPLSVEDWFHFFGSAPEHAPLLMVSAEQSEPQFMDTDNHIYHHMDPQDTSSDLAARAESQDADLTALRQATTMLRNNGLLDQDAFAKLTASIEEKAITPPDLPRPEPESPEEMQKSDPLGMQIWRLYHKQVGQLPNSERLENLSWRMMSMNLRRREMERQG